MSKLVSVDINGIWGRKNIVLNAHSDVNIFIGENGSGKTTVIQIIAAALHGDIQTLAQLPFQRAQLQVSNSSSTDRSSILIDKSDSTSHHSYSNLAFIVRPASSSDEYLANYLISREDGTVTALAEDQLQRRERYVAPRSVRAHREQTELRLVLQKLVRARWLSIHRSPTPQIHDEDPRYYRRSERSFESSVDQKLTALSNELARYLSSLESAAAREARDFQQTVFFSLLHDPTEDQLKEFVKNINLDEEQDALASIFDRFGLLREEYQPRLEDHIERLRDAVEELGQESMDFSSIGALFSSLRIDAVVREWNQLVERQAAIYSPRNDYVQMLNRLVANKSLKINPRNEVEASLPDDQTLSLAQLSSGEKQLIILLTEVLLQQREPWIFIADEPELSLHVKWQEQLLANLLALNPAAQIFVATHSPDIVGNYGDRVFTMEEVLV